MEFAFFSPADMAIVMAVALVVFGPKRLPEVGRQLGSFVRDLRKTVSQLTDAVEGSGADFRTILHDSPPSYPARPREPNASVDTGLMKPYDQRETPPAPPPVAEAVAVEHASAVEHCAAPALPTVVPAEGNEVR